MLIIKGQNTPKDKAKAQGKGVNLWLKIRKSTTIRTAVETVGI